MSLAEYCEITILLNIYAMNLEFLYNAFLRDVIGKVGC